MKNKSHIKFCVTFSIMGEDREFKHDYRNFEQEGKALEFYNEILENENLSTANFCKILGTTEC